MTSFLTCWSVCGSADDGTAGGSVPDAVDGNLNLKRCVKRIEVAAYANCR